jgi:hypothetical protein
LINAALPGTETVMIKIYFPPPPDEEQQRTTDPPSSPVLEVPAAVLQRHGARVLDPTTAPVAPGRPRPQATIYRAGTVLVPDVVRQDLGLRNGLNEVLTADLKVTLELPVAGLDRSDESARSARAGERGRPAGTLEITPTEVLPEGGVDAWRVLQHLRWVADNDGGRLGPSKDLVDQITLDHLLVGSAIDGYGGAILVGMNTASHGSPDLTDLFDRPQPGTSGRIPMTMVLRDPGRPAPPAGGRS